MKQAAWLQETRKMRFEEAYGGWQGGRLTQEDAAQVTKKKGQLNCPLSISSVISLLTT